MLDSGLTGEEDLGNKKCFYRGIPRLLQAEHVGSLEILNKMGTVYLESVLTS